ncbi:VOC family protein [Oenococcus sp.]|uniref:VOC family protein n=1 Tax=Oenococcus sp. TaxID=1979414 RepID=UPI0039E7B788
MTVIGISHTGMSVKDMPASLHFYVDLLGFTKKFALDNDGKPWINYLEIGNSHQFVELFYNYTDKRAHPDLFDYYSMNHLSLQVDDIHALEKQLTEAGVAIEHAPRLGRDHTWQMWVQDPDGNQIEFMEMTADSMQMQD